MNTRFRNVFAALAVTTAIGAVAAPASAQMFEQAYQNNNRDGLSSAVVMRQVDGGLYDSQNGTTGLASGGSSGDVLLCGSDDSTSTAQANSSCIIIGDGATAIIDLGQDSDGDQTADVDTTTVENNNGNLSDALEALNGG